MENKIYESISDRIGIFFNKEDVSYDIVDMEKDIILYSSIKDAQTAILIHTAYCAGYIDRKYEEEIQKVLEDE